MKLLKTPVLLLAYFLVTLAPAGIFSAQTGADPFAFFQPSVTITADERAKLDRGKPIAHALQARGTEVGLVAAVRVNTDGDRLVAWVRRMEEWKKNNHVLAVGRFSDPPRAEDLAGLELDSYDLAAIRSCRPGSCELKLSGLEMTQLQDAVEQSDADPGAAVQDAFRQMMLKRVQNYLTRGEIPPNEDHRNRVLPESRFESLLEHTPFLSDRLPKLAEDLRGYPTADEPGADLFLYWSKEHIARKAMVSVTQVTIVRNHRPDLPDALVVDRDIFSSHYINASLSVTALVCGGPGRPNYLVYVNRTDLDMLHGVFGGAIRWAIDRRLKDASDVLEVMKRRLESGPPPELQSSTSR